MRLDYELCDAMILDLYISYVVLGRRILAVLRLCSVQCGALS